MQMNYTKREHPSPVAMRDVLVRSLLWRGLMIGSLMVPAGVEMYAQQHPATRPNVVPAPPRPVQRSQNNSANRPANPGPATGQGAHNQEHLSEWMSRHRDMPVQQQQHALESEPGFHELPAPTQQRMRERLGQLNNMPAEQRNRVLERNEAMEHMAPQQRQQVRGAMLQLGALPEDRRKAVARAFRDLRTMPEAQRQQYLNSPAFRSQYNDQERATVNNLVAVEPLLPSRHPPEPPPQ